MQLVFLRHVSKWKDCDSIGAPNFACQEGKKCLGVRALYNYTNFNSFPTLSFHGFFFHEAEFHNERMNNTGGAVFRSYRDFDNFLILVVS
jgi:hypothetical protein